MMETKCKSNEMIKGFVHFSIIIFIAYLFLRIFLFIRFFLLLFNIFEHFANRFSSIYLVVS